MKRALPFLVLLQTLSAYAADAPRLALEGTLYRNDEVVSSFSIGTVTASGRPVQVDDVVEHGYVDRAVFRNGKVTFLPASVSSGLTLSIIANFTPENSVFIRVSGEASEIKGFSVKEIPGMTATAQEPRMRRNSFTSAIVAKKGESKVLVFGDCAPEIRNLSLCAYKLVTKVTGS